MNLSGESGRPPACTRKQHQLQLYPCPTPCPFVLAKVYGPPLRTEHTNTLPFPQIPTFFSLSFSPLQSCLPTSLLSPSSQKKQGKPPPSQDHSPPLPNMSGRDFTYKSSGANREVCAFPPPPSPADVSPHLPMLTTPQGNHYCARDYGSSAANSNSYHYSNR